MTTDDNATTWRDLARELTDQERAFFERIEQESPERMPAEVLLRYARGNIEGRIADTAYGDVPAPADATSVGRWEKDLKLGGWSRTLVWREFRDWEMSVDIDGRQQCDGTVERAISAYLDECPKFTSAEARRLAALLVEAADELDRLR
jgi:hypothetical protein